MGGGIHLQKHHQNYWATYNCWYPLHKIPVWQILNLPLTYISSNFTIPFDWMMGTIQIDNKTVYYPGQFIETKFISNTNESADRDGLFFQPKDAAFRQFEQS